jgi:glycosyltransferase involved in cell wall biosynthesis
MSHSLVDLAVVVPTVNRPSLLARALSSCFAGSVRPRKAIIVHDDPSCVDRYREVYEELDALPLVRLVHSHKEGPSAARNTGWRAASASWIYFLDDDDHVLADGMATIARGLETRVRDASILAFGSRVRRGGRCSDKLPGVVMQRYGVPFWAEIGTLVIRKDCLEEVGGFDTRIRLGENRDLMARLAARFEVGYVDQPIVCLDYEHVHPRQSEVEGTVEANIHLLRKNEAIYRKDPLWWRSAHLYPACHAAGRGRLRTSLELYWEWAQSSGRPIDARFIGAIASSAMSRFRVRR